MYVMIQFQLFFADDTHIFFSGSGPKDLESEINLNHIATWLKVNKLSLKIQKLTLWCSAEKNINAMLHYILKIK